MSAILQLPRGFPSDMAKLMMPGSLIVTYLGVRVPVLLITWCVLPRFHSPVMAASDLGVVCIVPDFLNMPLICPPRRTL